VPILVSEDIQSKSRVIIILGQTYQDLGILAHRILGGPGGVDRGSMVSVVRALQQHGSGPGNEDTAPGFILANTGQTTWSPELGRALTRVGINGAPMPSAVHNGPRDCDEDEDAAQYGGTASDRIPGNHDARDHIRAIFEDVVPVLVAAAATLDVIAVGDSADELEGYLDWTVTWARLSGRLNCLAIVGGYYEMDKLKCDGFREFMREVSFGFLPL
jgi:hypothetical protein